MQNVLFQYIAVLIPFVLIDSVWLTTMAPRLYRPRIGHLMASQPDLLAAGVFYALYLAALVLFVVSPAVEQGSGYLKVLLLGAAFGAVCYATYDLTNQATLKDWPVLISVVDILWGAVLTGSVSVIGVWLLRTVIG